MVLTVTEDTPADMLAGSMELLVQIPRDQFIQTQRVTVQRSTPMMDLLVQIASAHKLAASSYTLQAIGERGLVLSHQPNTPIGALDALQVKLLPKQGTFIPRKSRQPNQPFETTFRLQVHLPRNQLYVSRVSPKTNLGEILDEVCREKNLDRNKYELRHPGNISEKLDLNLTLQDYQIQEVNLHPRQPSRTLNNNNQEIMAYQREEDHRQHQHQQQQQQQSRHHGVFGFMFKKSKESSLSIDSLGERSASPVRGSSPARQSRSQKQFAPPPAPSRPLRKRRPAPKPPCIRDQQHNHHNQVQVTTKSKSNANESRPPPPSSDKDDKVVISHSRNSSDSSGYHEASVLSDNPDNGNGAGGRMPETLPRRGSRMHGILESPRKLAHTAHASKSLGNLAAMPLASSCNQAAQGTLSRGISNTSLTSTGQRKKRAAPAPPLVRPLPSAISVQGLERIVDSDESLTSDMELSKPSSDIEAMATGSSKASSDIGCQQTRPRQQQLPPLPSEKQKKPELQSSAVRTVPAAVESARVGKRELAPPVPKPRKTVPQASPVKPSPVPESPAEARKSVNLDDSPTSKDNDTSIASNSISDMHNSRPRQQLSLTEDEQAEINLAIDSILVAATGHSGDFEDNPSNNSSGDTSLINDEANSNRELHAQLLLQELSRVEKLSGARSKLSATPIDATTSNLETSLKTIPVSAQVEDPQAAISEAEESQPLQVLQQNKLNNNNKISPMISCKGTVGNEAVHTESKGKEENLDPTVPRIIETKLNEAHETPNASEFIEPECDLSLHKVKFTLDEDVEKNSPSCAVISAIPKCERPKANTAKNQNTEFASSSPKDLGSIKTNVVPYFEEEQKEQVIREEQEEAACIRRMPAESNLLGSGKSASPTDTDILLQKVSDTLSQVLEPPSPPPTPEDPESSSSPVVSLSSFANQHQQLTTNDSKSSTAAKKPKLSSRPSEKQQQQEEVVVGVKKVDEKQQQEREEVVEKKEQQQREPTSNDGSAQNLTLVSQQDTSDYVSASGEDLSIGDWEYQIPAPPSAFRDDSESEPPGQTTKQSISIKAEIHEGADKNKQLNSSSNSVELSNQSNSKRQETPDTVDAANNKSSKREPAATAIAGSGWQASLPRQKQTAEVISELETKIGSGNSRGIGPVVDPVALDDVHAPKIAPVENNLANFSITTYPRHKSLDIYGEQAEPEPQRQQQANDRLIGSFATLTRGENRNLANWSDQQSLQSLDKCHIDRKTASLKPIGSMERVAVDFSKHQTTDALETREPPRNKPASSVYRSKSYIILASNDKFQNRATNLELKKEEEKKEEVKKNERSSEFLSSSTDLPRTKLTINLDTVDSSTTTNTSSNKEKFSQWRDNILRKQEEPSKEKQLQSLQVLKSILPQLKNAQTTERNNYKNINLDTVSRQQEGQEPQQQRDSLLERTASSQSTAATTAATEIVKLRPAAHRRSHEPSKRFTYGGPPAVSLGSWSERPSLNVQIKSDTDYKLGGSGLSGARTIVSLNAEATESKESMSTAQEKHHQQTERPVQQEVKTTFAKKKENEEEKEKSCVDTSSVSFKELAKAFGQSEVRVRPKPAISTPNIHKVQRWSEYLDRDLGDRESRKNGFPEPNHTSTVNFGSNRTNGFANSHVKRYTSVIGITNNNDHNDDAPKQQKDFRFLNGQSKAVSHTTVPSQTAVKAFNGFEKNNMIPTPPTMPIITGVTLKSASTRPKSSPLTIQQDPRNQLLESIRNFGGRDRLKKAAERH